MKKEFVNYKQALNLKKLGFNETCFSYYEDVNLYTSNGFKYNYGDIVNGEGAALAPLIQQAFRFFRERYNLYTNIFKNGNDSYQYNINNGGASHMFHNFKTYEQAEEDCLNKLIGMVNDYTKTKIK